MLKFCPGGRRKDYAVNPGSKAAQKGVREGDVISSINGQSTKLLSNSDAHSLLRNAGQTLRLGLNEECSGSPKRRLYKPNISVDGKADSTKRTSSKPTPNGSIGGTTTTVSTTTTVATNGVKNDKGDVSEERNGILKNKNPPNSNSTQGGTTSKPVQDKGRRWRRQQQQEVRCFSARKETGGAGGARTQVAKEVSGDKSSAAERSDGKHKRNRRPRNRRKVRDNQNSVQGESEVVMEQSSFDNKKDREKDGGGAEEETTTATSKEIDGEVCAMECDIKETETIGNSGEDRGMEDTVKSESLSNSKTENGVVEDVTEDASKEGDEVNEHRETPEATIENNEIETKAIIETLKQEDEQIERNDDDQTVEIVATEESSEEHFAMVETEYKIIARIEKVEVTWETVEELDTFTMISETGEDGSSLKDQRIRHHADSQVMETEEAEIVTTSLSDKGISLEEHPEPRPPIPEDALREVLHSMNLECDEADVQRNLAETVFSEEDSAGAGSKSSPSGRRSKKSVSREKRSDSFPPYQPRQLEVIFEESSDLSDSEKRLESQVGHRHFVQETKAKGRAWQEVVLITETDEILSAEECDTEQLVELVESDDGGRSRSEGTGSAMIVYVDSSDDNILSDAGDENIQIVDFSKAEDVSVQEENISCHLTKETVESVVCETVSHVKGTTVSCEVVQERVYDKTISDTICEVKDEHPIQLNETSDEPLAVDSNEVPDEPQLLEVVDVGDNEIIEEQEVSEIFSLQDGETTDYQADDEQPEGEEFEDLANDLVDEAVSEVMVKSEVMSSFAYEEDGGVRYSKERREENSLADKQFIDLKKLKTEDKVENKPTTGNVEGTKIASKQSFMEEINECKVLRDAENNIIFPSSGIVECENIFNPSNVKSDIDEKQHEATNVDISSKLDNNKEEMSQTNRDSAVISSEEQASTTSHHSSSITEKCSKTLQEAIKSLNIMFSHPQTGQTKEEPNIGRSSEKGDFLKLSSTQTASPQSVAIQTEEAEASRPVSQSSVGSQNTARHYPRPVSEISVQTDSELWSDTDLEGDNFQLKRTKICKETSEERIESKVSKRIETLPNRLRLRDQHDLYMSDSEAQNRRPRSMLPSKKSNEYTCESDSEIVVLRPVRMRSRSESDTLRRRALQKKTHSMIDFQSDLASLVTFTRGRFLLEPKPLKELCVSLIATMPYGVEILQALNIPVTDLEVALRYKAPKDTGDFFVAMDTIPEESAANAEHLWAKNGRRMLISRKKHALSNASPDLDARGGEAGDGTQVPRERLEKEHRIPPRTSEVENHQRGEEEPIRRLLIEQGVDARTRRDEEIRASRGPDIVRQRPRTADSENIIRPRSWTPTMPVQRLVYLSPSQRRSYHGAVSPDEAAKLLDLHYKFQSRRSYHEPEVLDPLRPRVPSRDSSVSSATVAKPTGPLPKTASCEGQSVTSRAQIIFHPEEWNERPGGDSGPRRLLAIIRAENTEQGDSRRRLVRSDACLQEKMGLLELYEKKFSDRDVATRSDYDTCSTGRTSPMSPNDEQRLRVRLLSDWLTLARRDVSEGGSGSVTPLSPRSFREEQSVATQTEPRRFQAERYKISKKGDIAVIQSNDSDEHVLRRRPTDSQHPRPKSMPAAVSGGDYFREQMYNEYMSKVAERAERKHQKVLKISKPANELGTPCSDRPEEVMLKEFMGKVRERMDKYGINYEEGGDDAAGTASVEPMSAQEEDNSFIIEGGATLPKHLQDDSDFFLADDDSSADDGIGVTSFIEGDGIGCDLLHEIDEALGRKFRLKSGSTVLAPTFKATAPKPIWTPSQKPEEISEKKEQHQQQNQQEKQEGKDAQDASPIWTPKSGASPTTERKGFRPVNFETAIPKKARSELFQESKSVPVPEESFAWQSKEGGSPLKSPSSDRSAASSAISSSLDKHLTQGSSATFASTGPNFSSRLPRAQNPTITLLQKAREGQLPRGALYLDHKMNSKEDDKPLIGPNEVVYTVKHEYESEDEEKPRKIVELGPRKYEGIGPTTRDGIPVGLRTGIKEENQAKWYKKMYDSLHKSGKDDEYVTVRYKTRRSGQYPYSSAGGYVSEPEHMGYDSDIGYSAKYATLDRRRIKNKDYDFTTSTLPRSKYVPASAKYDVYKNQPGKIEDYEPGHSSIAEKEAKMWWDEVLDIFDGEEQEAEVKPSERPNPPQSKPFMQYALKESGYESDSTLVFKRREENMQNLSPSEQKVAYKSIQKGGEVPLHGLRKSAPERPKEPVIGPVPIPKPRNSYRRDWAQESPHKYAESEVTIHYRSPIRAQVKEAVSEEELARRQEEAMRRIYQEERRRKYLQELQDMESRRHTDNFTPSQKSPIPLNRYDDFLEDVPKTKPRDRTPEPKMVARALYNFVGQSSRELSFRRGDIIFVRRQVDKNWYEGEHNAMIGLFPFNYVEIIPYDGVRTTPKRPSEGQARAKFNFVAQTHLELSLIKGELVVLTQRVDDNWFEGRIGNRKGIFPVSYVDVLVEPGERPVTPAGPVTKPIGSPASHALMMNGSIQTTQNPSYYNQKLSYTSPYSSLTRHGYSSNQLAPVNQTLHIDTRSEPVPYRALYNYKPQNEDELELCEGDTVYVMEKCDDGWYVGSSQRTGYFGTFPGNYVERI